MNKDNNYNVTSRGWENIYDRNIQYKSLFMTGCISFMFLLIFLISMFFPLRANVDDSLFSVFMSVTSLVMFFVTLFLIYIRIKSVKRATISLKIIAFYSCVEGNNVRKQKENYKLYGTEFLDFVKQKFGQNTLEKIELNLNF